jgi:UDP-N-acetylmuramyl pentapeptide phosphotransferase/UDP-N-acetylglucosamine-1-phosphate transferase
VHSTPIPTLGGVAIFAGLLFSIVLWTPFEAFGDLQYILSALIIIFLIGAKDDISPVAPSKKIAAQLFASFILVFKANIRLTSLYGIFGIGTLPEWASIVLSMFTILVIINAFNLIDGINGLSGSIGALISMSLGSWFLFVDRVELAIVAFSLAGSIIAFLRYNYTPAKIFMGDTGSLIIGMVCAILAIEFIEVHREIRPSPYAFDSTPAIAVAILIIPLFDTLRVFTTRILKGKSPMKPDRSHIHHLLIDTGLSHMQATGVLVGVNLGFIALAIRLQHIGSLNLLLIILALATALSVGLYFYANSKTSAKPKSTANA